MALLYIPSQHYIVQLKCNGFIGISYKMHFWRRVEQNWFTDINNVADILNYHHKCYILCNEYRSLSQFRLLEDFEIFVAKLSILCEVF